MRVFKQEGCSKTVSTKILSVDEGKAGRGRGVSSQVKGEGVGTVLPFRKLLQTSRPAMWGCGSEDGGAGGRAVRSNRRAEERQARTFDCSVVIEKFSKLAHPPTPGKDGALLLHN